METSHRARARVFSGGILGIGAVGGVLLFTALSGYAVWLLTFSVFTQVAVLLHTGVGVLAVAGFAIWQISHWLGGRKSPRNWRKVSAYFGFWLLAANLASGLVLTWQALFGRHSGQGWHLAHLWTAVLALPFLAYHLWPARVAGESGGISRMRRQAWTRALAVSTVLFALAVGLSLHYWRHGKAEAQRQRIGSSDFQPSFVNTTTGRPIAVERLANSASCGTSDCHSAIFQEWKSSAHHWSAEDQFFQEVRLVTTRVKGVRETEKCGACHDPVSMLSGHKDPTLGKSSPGYKEGDSCVVCHAVRHMDERGIGSYALGTTKAYLHEGDSGRYPRLLNHFLIRAYPGQHNRDYDLTLARKPESCAPCHKEYDLLDEREGPVQVETQFDDWKQGQWNTDPDPGRRLYCQQCHMQLDAGAPDAYDLKRGFGRRHRNHAFTAANQYMPSALTVEDAEAHVERVHQWLRGERAVPEIEKAWPRGPIVELSIAAPASAAAGAAMALTITLANRKVGHGFPTGPLNIARAWIEVVVEDAAGSRVFHTGLLDERNRIEDGSYVLKPLAIDMAGRMILRPDLWHPVGPKYRRAVLAGQADTYVYEFRAPAASRGPLTVRARLRYSKANQFFMDAVYPEGGRRAPVTDLASAQAAIRLR